MNQTNFNSFVSSNRSYQYSSNSNDLENILFNNDYINLYQKKKIEGSKCFTKRNNESKYEENKNDLEGEFSNKINDENFHELNKELTSESNLDKNFNRRLNIFSPKDNNSLKEIPEFTTFGKISINSFYNDNNIYDKDKIIKIQSVWRGNIIRNKIYGIIYMTILYRNFYDKLFYLLTKNVRLFVLKIMFIHYKLKKIFNYNINKYFQRWKCITKLLIYKSKKSNDAIIFKKRKIDKKNNKLSLFKRYFNIWKQNIIRHDIFINLIYNRKQLISNNNKVNNINIFDRNQQDKNEILRRSLSIYENYQNDNLFIKRYYFYRWNNQVKSIEIYELKKRILIYVINTISKKTELKILKKYYTRWKSFIFKNGLYTKKIAKNKEVKKQKKVKNTDNKFKENILAFDNKETEKYLLINQKKANKKSLFNSKKIKRLWLISQKNTLYNYIK